MTLLVAGTPIGMVPVMVATKPVDFRKGAEGLAALVRETMCVDPFSGVIYVFHARRADRVKLVWWNGTGVCLFAKRLEDGRFCWASVTVGAVWLTAAQLQALLEGLDWRRVHETRRDYQEFRLWTCIVGSMESPNGTTERTGYPGCDLGPAPGWGGRQISIRQQWPAGPT